MRSVLFSLCLLLVLCIANCEAQNELNPTEDPNLTIDGDGGQPRDPGRLIKLLWSPVRNTLDTAKRILGIPLGNFSESIEAVRLQTFKIFMRIYNKTYTPDEIKRRMDIFFLRREEIEESVKAFREGRSSFMMRENAHLDEEDEELKKLTGAIMPDEKEMEPEELEAMHKTSATWDRYQDPDHRDHDDDDDDDGDEDDDNNFRSKTNLTEDDGKIRVRAQIPVQKDWRDSGCVAKPMDQMACGACYAIATMNTVETMKCLQTDSAPILSSQQIVDCATPRAGYNNFGCDGGWPTRVLKYLKNVGIAARETCYPFVMQQNSCKLRQVQGKSGCTVAASPTNSREIEYKVLNNENDILYHVANTGPVITVMKASQKFLYYGDGIFDDPSCSRRRDDVDHAITIVGYGRQNGVNYWIIKNSWGSTTWGKKGYALYKRGTNACSIGHWGWVVTK